MAGDVVIRAFEAADLPRLQVIRAEAFAPVFASFREIVGPEISAIEFAAADAEQAELLNTICARESADEVFVAEIDGAVAGFVSLTMNTAKGTGEIGLNAVDPDHSGKGVGTRMYEFALSRMKEAGIRLATVGTGGDPSHAPARRAYEKAGFGPFLPSQYMYKLL